MVWVETGLVSQGDNLNSKVVGGKSKTISLKILKCCIDLRITEQANGCFLEVHNNNQLSFILSMIYLLYMAPCTSTKAHLSGKC